MRWLVQLQRGLALLFFCGAIDAATDDLEFADKLYSERYYHLAAQYYEDYVKSGPKKDADDAYLNLFKIYKKLESEETSDEQRKLLGDKAQLFFSNIKDRQNPQMRLEKVESDMGILRTIRADFESGKTKEAMDKVSKVEQARRTFRDMVSVLDGIREESSKKMDEMGSLDEADLKKRAKEFDKNSEIYLNSNLLFGEACILYAYIVGRSDADALVWMQKMAWSYPDFIANYVDSPPATIGNIYLGEVNILLENYNDDFKQPVNGVEVGVTLFNDAIAGLQELEKKYPAWVKPWIMRAYSRLVSALEQVGQPEKSIQALDELFKWKKPDTFSYAKDREFHSHMMTLLEKKCRLMLKLYEKGDTKILSKIYEAVNEGFTTARNMKSPWANNFKVLLASLPDDPNIRQTADTTFFKANAVFKKAQQVESEKNDVQAREHYFEAALLYKQAIGMSVEAGQAKVESIVPESSYRMGLCYTKLDNLTLALSAFLRAVDLFPSDKYPKATHPEIYESAKRCAKSAKFCAEKQYNSFGRQNFDQELYERTLNIISQMFPEEGGDPEYYLGQLRQTAEEYALAIDYFNKIKKESVLYPLSLFRIVECQYLQRVKQARDEMTLLEEGLKSFANVLEDVKAFQPVAGSDPSAPSVGMLKKDEAISRILRKMAELHYKAEDFAKAREKYRLILEQVQDVDEKKTAWMRLILCDYKLDDLGAMKADIEALLNLKVPNWEPVERKGDLVRFYKLQGELILRKKITALNKELEDLAAGKGKASQEFLKAESALAAAYLEVADIYAKAIDISSEREQVLLENVIKFYFNYDRDATRALNRLKLYFRWMPNEPKMNELYRKMLGKSEEQWDEAIGGHLKNINSFKIQNLYKQFLNALFDKQDYSTMSMLEMKDLQEKSGDNPRNYQSAVAILDSMLQLQAEDILFKNKVVPELTALKEELKQSTNFYTFKYQLAQCYLRKDLYKNAAGLFTELAGYFVEQYNVRIELAKARFAEGTKDGYKKAEAIFTELVNIIPKPYSQKNYEPLDYFNLGFWLIKTRMALLGHDEGREKEVLEYWKHFRSMIYQDLEYFRKDEERLNLLNIRLADRPVHAKLVDEIKVWVEKNIFPVIQRTEHPLSKDTWQAILGET